jgi:hypothetical protein
MPPQPLLGRKKELADVLRLVRLDGSRLVTVAGPSGVGKTRFAVEVAAELSGGREVVLLDDAAAGDIADHGDAVVIATSGMRLGVPGERAYPLRPLAEAPAVELFRQRAEGAAPGFDAAYAELAALCRRLGRLPLAIELVAARGSDGLRAPIDGTWTLHRTIAWSYEQLNEREQDVLRAVAAGATAEVDPAAVAELVRLHLLTPTEAGVEIHSAIREFAASV